MRDHVGTVVWRDTLLATPFETLPGDAPETFWTAVKEATSRVRAVGGDPVLIIASSVQPPWINDWRWGGQESGVRKPADLTFNRETNKGQGYEFSMNDTPVYRGATFHGESYVIPRQLFKRACFHDYGSGVPVDVQFEDDSDNAWRGTLVVQYQRHVEIAPLEAFRIVHDVKAPGSAFDRKSPLHLPVE